MPKVTDEYRLARREEILDVAIGLFTDVGYTRASIADLVSASGLSAGAIYGNFPGGKQEIFVAAATRILRSRQRELEQRRRDHGILSPGEIMSGLIAGISSEQVSIVLPQLWGEAVVDAEILGLVRNVFLELRATIDAQLADWADANPDKIDGDPREWAARAGPVILSTAPGFILQRALLADFDTESYLEMLPSLLPH